MPADPLVDAQVIAQDVLDVCPETVRRLYRDGKIPGYQVGRYIKFDPVEVLDALRSSLASAGHRSAVAPDFDAI